MSEKLSQDRLEEISREPLTATNNNVLAMADELIKARKVIAEADEYAKLAFNVVGSLRSSLR